MGHLNPYDVEFTATLDGKTKQPFRTVEDIRKEWKGYNEKAHAREGRRRWGKCYDDEDDKDDERDSGLDEPCVNSSYIDYTHPSIVSFGVAP